MSDRNPNFHSRRSIRLKGYDYSRAGLYFITLCVQNRERLFGEIRPVESFGAASVEASVETLVEAIVGAILRDRPENSDNISKDDENSNISKDYHESDIFRDDHDPNIFKGDHAGSPRQRQQMILNDAGKMIGKWYAELENKFPNIRCHEMVIMPNHFHCILEIVKDNNNSNIDTNDQPNSPYGLHNKKYNPVIGEVVGWFKTMTTNEYIRRVKSDGWKAFYGKLWQRDYWEHIVRDEASLIRIANYINSNPENWKEDQLNA